MKVYILLAACVIISLSSCETSKSLFGKKSAHDAYGDKLKSAGLAETALGRQWFSAADKALSSAIQVKLPHKQVGYFAADKPQAIGLKFEATRGNSIIIELTKTPRTNFNLYAELFKLASNGDPSLVTSFDSLQTKFEFVANQDEMLLLRLQPELLKSGSYALSLSVAPSLAFPVPGGKMQSFWGAARDGGLRSHEGIDIFAPRSTPTIAASDGIISSVRDGGIGGKVIFLRTEDRPLNLYYAHLDSQLVFQGHRVKKGDTIGLVGNTGNAASTSPHLHFGIYTYEGAIDPLPFINPVVREAPEVIIKPEQLQPLYRLDHKLSLQSKIYPPHTVAQPLAASSTEFLVELPDGIRTTISKKDLSVSSKELAQTFLKDEAALYEQPDSSSGIKTLLSRSSPISVLGYFEDFVLVSSKNDLRGWILRRFF